MNTTKPWYIRSQTNGEIKGPFPGGQISQEMLLGRYNMDDEVSHDKEEWAAIGSIAELVPGIFTENKKEPGFEDRLAAARRWADERRGVDDVEDERRSKESYESAEIKRLHKLASGGGEKNSPIAIFMQVGFVFSIVVAVLVLAFKYSPEDKNAIDCTEPAKQGVNWSGCNLSGIQLLKENLVAVNLMNANLQTANLYGADLSHANLKYVQLHLATLKYTNFTKADLTGANLMGADLSGAIFHQANLSYVSFRDAIIVDTDFSNARLDNAIWVDGRKCKIGSIGFCN